MLHKTSFITDLNIQKNNSVETPMIGLINNNIILELNLQ